MSGLLAAARGLCRSSLPSAGSAAAAAASCCRWLSSSSSSSPAAFALQQQTVSRLQQAQQLLQPCNPWQAQQTQAQQQQWRRLYYAAAGAGLDDGGTKATTILCVRRGSEVVIIGDGQATQKDFIVKSNVRKVRRIGPNAVGGFAGVAVDGLALLERLETKLEEHPGQLQRAAVELAKMWRQDKILRELDASLIVADAETTLWLMGNGDVLEAGADGVIGIGSGADFAESAARALLQLQRERQQQQQEEQEAGSSDDDERLSQPSSHAVPSAAGGCDSAAAAAGVDGLSLMEVAQVAMKIAADCCVYTNSNFTWHHIKADGSIVSGDGPGDASSKSSVQQQKTAAAG